MDKPRIVADETDGLKLLVFALDAMEAVGNKLAGRLRLTKTGARNFGSAKWALGRVIADVVETVPDVQRHTLRKNLENVTYRVGVRKPWDNKQDAEYGMWMSWEAVYALLGAARSACLTCDLTPDKQRQCPLAKALDELPTSKDETARGCGYFGRI